VKLGFIGFGGAAYGLATGLAENGLIELSFFDSQQDSTRTGPLIRQRAAETGIQQRKSLADLAKNTDVIVSCTTGSAALAVARQVSRYLQPSQLYVDVNTASPEAMEDAGRAIESSGAQFADVAMLGAVPAFLHKVPCLASGNGAELFKTLMLPHGMEIAVVGSRPGQASAIKLFRSIFMKGFLALLLEMLNASHRFQVDSIVLDSLAQTMEKNDFLETVRLQLAKGVINAERMQHEMETVEQALKDSGLSATMSAATKKTLAWCNSLGLAERFEYEMPSSLNEILDALTSSKRR
jgi:3-hydroxyisobutyrate dehydrogenase-like beta-hydroxyacid dehydrogenase